MAKEMKMAQSQKAHLVNHNESMDQIDEFSKFRTQILSPQQISLSYYHSIVLHLLHTYICSMDRDLLKQYLRTKISLNFVYKNVMCPLCVII
jgi:hypothetical protein